MENNPLSPISSIINPEKELSPTVRAFILGRYTGGEKPKSISNDLQIPLQTIYTTIRRSSSRSHCISKPRTGRPKSLSETAKRAIIRLIKKNPFITYQEVSETLQLSICRRTLFSVINESGYGNWKAQKRPLLTPKVAQRRYEWALKYKNWGYREWSSVIWSDECSVELGSGQRDQWVFRVNQSGEKWKKDYIQPYKHGKGIRVMVWAAIWGDRRSELIRLERDFESKKHGFTSRSYLTLLEEMIPTIWEPGLIFMQDNAPIHSSRLIKDWFENHQITLMDWPPHSPDMNPIEHMWFPLKEGVYNINPNIEHIKGSVEKREDQLWEVLETSWSKIRQDIQVELVRSMESRIRAVLEAKGWYTKY